MVELAKNPGALFDALNSLKTTGKTKFSVPALLAAGSQVDIVDQVLTQITHFEDKHALFFFTGCEWQIRHRTNSNV